MERKQKYKLKNLMPGCIELIGAVIRCAILDYQNPSIKKYYYHDYVSAKRFLFKAGRLESFLHQFGMDGSIDCDYVRRIAKYKDCKYIRGQYEWNYSAHDK